MTEHLKNEMRSRPAGEYCPYYFRAVGYRSCEVEDPSVKRASGIATLFKLPPPHIYENDLIVGSMRPLFRVLTEEEKRESFEMVSALPERNFITNYDHFAPDYETVLTVGLDGLLAKIQDSKQAHAGDCEAESILEGMRITLEALQNKLEAYAAHASKLKGKEGYSIERLSEIEANCNQIAHHAPKSFAEGLQLVWMIHSCFVCEGRYAMALGRLDQYLYPLYRRDVESGVLTEERAVALLENVFAKICERRFYLNADDVVNVCIGGVDENGSCAINRLSHCILWAVRNVNMPGPNLSARITSDTPDSFLDECLKVIGTGLGYPALMNDEVNMAALRRYGYAEKDIRNYSMVGCIENFITGMQPPWSDGRFDPPKYLESLLLEREEQAHRRAAIGARPVREIDSMETLMEELQKQLDFGIKEYVECFNRANLVTEPQKHASPFLSCFCRDCIGRGRDINGGGAVYPSVHGAALMGVGTLSDSLSAIEKVVFCDREATLEELAFAMKQNFEGEYRPLREKLLAAPKYGNNDPFVDKYAVWFTDYLSRGFMKYKTNDGGGFYTAMAANTSNIFAGRTLGATPDGRLAGEPLSDAASPTYGRDVKGATSTLLSVSKPDYTLCACGTVVNQKYSPSMFEDGKREKLLQMIKVYFARGGQEIQINATSVETLKDAMEHPERYPSLVVRVSGFSAFYVTLGRDVQEDILHRTQQG